MPYQPVADDLDAFLHMPKGEDQRIESDHILQGILITLLEIPPPHQQVMSTICNNVHVSIGNFQDKLYLKQQWQDQQQN